MNELKIFSSSEFGQVRTVIINSEPWFVGNDVAKYWNTKTYTLPCGTMLMKKIKGSAR